jgi:hypothetical protein
MKAKVLGLLVFGLLGSWTAANAMAVTVYFRTTFINIENDDLGLFPAWGIEIGEDYFGKYAYDDAVTNIDDWAHYDAWPYLRISGNFADTFTAMTIQAINEDLPGGADNYEVVSRCSVGDVPCKFHISMIGPWGYGPDEGTGLGHPIKPPPIFGVPVWGTWFSYHLTDGSIDGGGVIFGVTTLSQTPFSHSAPEPGTLALLGLGLAGLGLSRRRLAA